MLNANGMKIRAVAMFCGMGIRTLRFQALCRQGIPVIEKNGGVFA
jgi:hypothetical protein